MSADHQRSDVESPSGPFTGKNRRVVLLRILHAIRNPRPGPLIGFGFVVMLTAALLRTPSPPSEVVPALPADLRAPPWSEHTLSEALTEGVAAYAAGQLDEAVRRLERAETTGVSDLLRLTYLGSALARAGRYAEALPALEAAVRGSLPDPWHGEARWARAVALRETGQGNEALVDLASEEGEVGERARGTLERSSTEAPR